VRLAVGPGVPEKEAALLLSRSKIGNARLRRRDEVGNARDLQHVSAATTSARRARCGSGRRLAQASEARGRPTSGQDTGESRYADMGMHRLNTPDAVHHSHLTQPIYCSRYSYCSVLRPESIAFAM